MSLAQDIGQISSHPLTAASDAPYLWDIEVSVHMQGEIKRLASRNHKISYELSESQTEAKVGLSELQDKKAVPNMDFVLLIRDSLINVPVGFQTVNEHHEQAYMINILTDVTPAALRKKQCAAQLDSDQNLIYEVNEDTTTEAAEDEEEKESQQQLGINEYIFLIDRSGSMSG